MWQTTSVARGNEPSVVVVGSGLAGLTCAAELAEAGCRTTVVSPGRAGRDGATHRVHGLAPWILLTAPCSRGDSPDLFLQDLRRRGGGMGREGLDRVLAESAHDAALRLIEELDLERIDPGPVLLPGDEFPRGLRCLPRNRHVMLAPALARCAADGVHLRERTLVFGLLLRNDRAAGVVAIGRDDRDPSLVEADAVVLACGGGGAVFPVTTSPRWCRGTGLALASAAGVMLHRAGLAQVLPVTATPPLFFPSSAALLRSRIEIDGRPLGSDRDVEATTVAIAEAVRAGASVSLEPTADAVAILPASVRASSAFRKFGRVPLTVALHHAIGGVAIDAWGRTSLAGLYACGEAAGGVQGRRRTMGTGLLEAAVFARRAAQAVVGDGRKDRPAGTGAPRPVAVCAPADPARAERRLDELMGPLVLVRPGGEVEAAERELSSWSRRVFDPGSAQAPGALAGIRLEAALAMLRGFREDRPAVEAVAPEGGHGRVDGAHERQADS